MKPENLPKLETGLTVVVRQNHLGSVIRLWVLMADGTRHTLKKWDCPSGQPTPDQLRDVLAALTDDVGQAVIGCVGVQGVLKV